MIGFELLCNNKCTILLEVVCYKHEVQCHESRVPIPLPTQEVFLLLDLLTVASFCVVPFLCTRRHLLKLPVIGWLFLTSGVLGLNWSLYEKRMNEFILLIHQIRHLEKYLQHFFSKQLKLLPKFTRFKCALVDSVCHTRLLLLFFYYPIISIKYMSIKDFFKYKYAVKMTYLQCGYLVKKWTFFLPVNHESIRVAINHGK